MVTCSRFADVLPSDPMTILDLRRDLRLGSSLSGPADESSVAEVDKNPHLASGPGDLIRSEAVGGVETDDAGGLGAKRFGLNFVGDLPRTSQIVRATELPSKPCATCRFWYYDKGQEVVRREGLGQVPNAEGGFLREGTTNMDDVVGTEGPYDHRAIGLCAQWSKGHNLRLSHRMGTCEEWAGRGKLWRWL